VPVLLACFCRSDKERLEKILRKAGLHVSFQWPKKILELVNDVREEIEKMGYERKAFFYETEANISGRKSEYQDRMQEEGRRKV
jgi:hypothetical protein